MTDDEREGVRLRRTRTRTVWIVVVIAVVFLALLIDFIVQNDQRITIHFLGASGRISEALALVIAALAGAIVVLLISAARIVQLRLAVRRHNRALRRGAAADGRAKPVETEDQP
jgi:uncharacterized integral membrane protein